MSERDKKLWDFHELENRESFALAQPRLKFLAKQVCSLKQSGKVIDIGFGNGFFFEALYSRNKNFKLYGLDLSKNNVQLTQKEMRKLNINTELKSGSIDSAPFQNDYFDIVVASEVLEHLDDSMLQKGLLEISRILKPGGYFLATVPANEKLQDLLCYCPKCGYSFHRWGHKQSFNEKKLKTIFIEQNFQIKNIKHLTFFGERLKDNLIISKIKFQLRKILFILFKRIFASQWWFFFI